MSFVNILYIFNNVKLRFYGLSSTVATHGVASGCDCRAGSISGNMAQVIEGCS